MSHFKSKICKSTHTNIVQPKWKEPANFQRFVKWSNKNFSWMGLLVYSVFMPWRVPSFICYLYVVLVSHWLTLYQMCNNCIQFAKRLQHNFIFDSIIKFSNLRPLQYLSCSIAIHLICEAAVFIPEIVLDKNSFYYFHYCNSYVDCYKSLQLLNIKVTFKFKPKSII